MRNDTSDNLNKSMEAGLELLVRRLSRLASRVEKVEEELYRAADDLQLLFEQAQGNKPIILEKPNYRNLYAKNRAKAAQEREKRQAAIGVENVTIDWKADGSAKVSVVGYPKFKLPRNLAELLNVLRQDTGSADDHLVGWKSISELAVLLGKKLGKSFKRHAVIQSVYRLRNALRKVGINPLLVEGSRSKGYRFCQRKSGFVTCDWE